MSHLDYNYEKDVFKKEIKKKKKQSEDIHLVCHLLILKLKVCI